MLRFLRWLVSLLPFGAPERSGGNLEGQARIVAEAVGAFRADVNQRLRCGIPFTLEEWLALGDDEVGKELKAIYEEEHVAHQRKIMALQARFFWDAIGTGRLASGAVWDDLDEEQQDMLLIQHAKILDKVNSA